MNLKSDLYIKDKDTGKVYAVYSIRNDKNGYPHFLIYDREQWLWRSAKYYAPLRTDVEAALNKLKI